MAALLQQALSRGMKPGYAKKLVDAFLAEEQRRGGDGEKESTPAPQFPDPTALIEPLSDRELEVLQLIAEGLTNQEIANKLFLSLNTVKVHTRNIYGKLDAHHRTGAVAKARVLGILHPN